MAVAVDMLMKIQAGNMLQIGFRSCDVFLKNHMGRDADHHNHEQPTNKMML